jgi:hypothetical protein
VLYANRTDTAGLCAGACVALVVADRGGRAEHALGEPALSGRTTGVEGNVMAAPNIGHSVIRIVNFFVILILLNLLGQPIANAIPSAAQNVRDVLAELWNGIKDLVPNNWSNYYRHHH